MQAVLLITSTILVILSPITYIVSILKGKSKPHRMTRFILFFVLTLNFFSILAARGNTGAVIFAGITFVQALVIFFLSLWRGIGGTNTLDWICFIIAALGILGWKITGNPFAGIVFAILADFVAYLPAFIKTWKYPHTESPWYYLTGMFAAFFSLIAYTIELASIFQIYIIICCAVMFVCIYH
ncbi:MAG: hypothetical protein KGJ07_07445, partial [Patescibacteria group bacterium]|nr:hypothetical protein [Patescibacteria group bacterium]